MSTVVLWPGLFLHWVFKPGAETFQFWLRSWARSILRGAGIRLHVTARQPIDTPVVFVANHQNALDIVTTAAGLPVPFGFTPKAALRRAPLLGHILSRAESVFVDRTTPQRAARSLVEAGAQIRAGRSVLVYAEGGRTWQRELLPFLRGAFLLAVEAGVPLVPVAADGNLGLLDERRFVARPGTSYLAIGPPIPTAGCTRRDIPRLREEVRTWIAHELGLEETEDA